MALRQIRLFGDEILSKRSKEVLVVDDKMIWLILCIIQKMVEG